MSNEVDPTGDRAEEPDVVVAQALAGVVRDGGRGLAGEPRRVQGMVNDVLGAEGRTRRAEVDAVVMAAEESIPESLLANAVTLDQAVESLRVRGLDGDIARFAVEVWRYALGMLAEDAEPPSLTNSLRTPTGSVPTDIGDTVHPDHAVAMTSLGDDSAGPTTDEATGRRRVALIAGAAIAAVALLVVAVVVSSGGGDDTLAVTDNTVVDSTTPSTTAAAAPATTTSTSTTTEAVTDDPEPVALAFDAETLERAELNRTWTLEEGELVGTLAFTNERDKQTTERLYEVIPTSLAATADAVTSEPEHVVIDVGGRVGPQGFRSAAKPAELTVIAWDLEIPAGGTENVTYRIDVGDDATADDLDRWRQEHAEAIQAFEQVRNTPPLLDVALSAPKITVGDDVTLSGTTDPTATIHVRGEPVDVGDDGSFSFTTTAAEVGTSTFPVVARSRFDIEVEQTLTVEVEPAPTTTRPAPTTTRPAPTTTRPRSNEQPATNTTLPPTKTPAPAPAPAPAPPRSTTTTTTTTAPATPPPPPGGTAPDFEPPPPPLSVSISGPSLVTVGCVYTWSASASESASYAWSGMFATSGSSFQGQVNYAGQFSLTVTATASDGRSAQRSITINAQPPVGSGCG